MGTRGFFWELDENKSILTGNVTDGNKRIFWELDGNKKILMGY